MNAAEPPAWSPRETPTTSPTGPPAAFVAECRDLFEGRLQGPDEARAAVLAALADGEPYALAWSVHGREVGARRLGVLAEVVRGALRTCAAAYRGPALGSRLERARRVLAADTLLTFAWELAADLPAELGAEPIGLLGEALGAGQLERLVSGETPDPDAEAAAFLAAALRPPRA